MMPRAFSPFKPDRYSSQSSSSQFPLLRRSRWPYILLTVCALYLYFSSGHLSLFATHGAAPHAPSLRFTSIDWSRYAYSQYATTSAHLCNSVMLFETLSRLNSKAARILFYPSTWDTDISSLSDRDSQLLVKARDWYNVRLIPADMPTKGSKGGRDGTYNASFAKFLPWTETVYDRILQLDSDVTLFRHLDEVFLLPRAPVAMMRAHWELPDQRLLTSMMVLLEPSDEEFRRLTSAVLNSGDYDMEVLNRLYGDSALVLPHRQYGLLSGEFRKDDHSSYLGNDYGPWNAATAIREASLVHFSDWPLPKPWIMWPHNLIGEIMPQCRWTRDEEDCSDKTVWLELYDDFRKRRKEVCALLSELAPEWPPRGRNSTSTAKVTSRGAGEK